MSDPVDEGTDERGNGWFRNTAALSIGDGQEWALDLAVYAGHHRHQTAAFFDDLARDAETGWDRGRTWWDPEFHALGLTARADGRLVTFDVELRFPPSREERIRESISVPTSRVGRVGVDIRKFLNFD